MTKQDFKDLNNTVRHIQNHPLSLRFPKLDTSSVRICGFSDAAFANNRDLTSQLGMVILLCDKQSNCALIHYSSWKCSRVTRSVLAAETYAFAACFDFAYALQKDLHHILGFRSPIIMYTDSMSLFDTITRLTNLTEKRLLIDVTVLRESYSKAEIANIAHVSSQKNLADCLIKKVRSKELEKVMLLGKFDVVVNKWIIHNESK